MLLNNANVTYREWWKVQW